MLVNGEPCESVGIDCTEGDRMRLCYACTDDDGLRYEFPLSEILTQKWDGTERCPISADLWSLGRNEMYILGKFNV